MNDTIEVEAFRFCFIDLRNALEPLNTWNEILSKLNEVLFAEMKNELVFRNRQ